MIKKLAFLTLFLLLMAVGARANLIAYYPFEGNANDMSGYGNAANGTLVGTPTYDVGPTNYGQALKLSSTSNYVNCGTDSKFNITGPMTVSVWIKVTSWSTAWNAVVTKGDSAWRLHRDNATDHLNWTCTGTTGGGVSGVKAVNDDQWHHVAGVYDGANLILYVDGLVDGTLASTGNTATNTNRMLIAENDTYTGRTFNGWIDEVRIYDSGLTQGEVLAVMVGKKGLPSSPKPSGTGVSIDAGGISWKPGEYAETHNVFFGTDFNDVNEATLANPNGTTVYEGLAKEVNSIPMGRFPYDMTYYWKVDEVNAPSKPATISGGVWSFSIEAAGNVLPNTSIIAVTATGEPAYPGEQEPNYTCNGKGLDPNGMHTDKYPDMWLVSADGPGIAWIQYEFDKVYKFHDMLVWNYNEESPGQGFGVQDANVAYSMDGETWTALPLQKFNEATGDNTCVANTTVEFNGAVAKYIRITFLTSFEGSDVYGLSEVRFLAEPTYAQTPTPSSGSTTRQAVDVNLKWKAGRYSVQHYVYISTDANDVNNVPGHSVDPIIVNDASCKPGLDLNKKYYWRVDEVNTANAYSTWTGPTWNFLSVQYLVLDDFEKGYGNNPDTNAVWVTWIDGVSSASNGSTIGVGDAPGLNTTIYHGASGKSAPVYYDNTVTTETDSFVTAQSINLQQKTANWSIGHPITLTIWFRGETTNTIGDEEMYCTFGGKTVVYNGNLKAYLATTEWRQWDVNLVDLGVNLTNVPDIRIGIRKTGATGSKGIIYLDDIQLTGIKAIYVGPSTIFEAEAMTLTGIMRTSTGTTGFLGTGYVDTDSAKTSSTEPNLLSLATYPFTSTGGTYIINARIRSLFIFSGFQTRDSFWVRIINSSGASAATNVTLQNANGWANWDGNNPGFGAWGWRQVWNTTATTPAQNLNVIWTLPAGTYTIQFSYKETGTLLDAIEVMKVGN